MPLSTEQKIFLVITFFSNGQSVVLTQRGFSREYGINNPVPRRTVYNIITKFRTHGTVLNRYQGCGRRRTGRSEEHRRQVEQLIQEGTPTSLRKLARLLGDISYVTVRAILRLDIKAKPYHMELLHHLTPADLQRRIECCNLILGFVREENLPLFFMSDEARFFLDGHVNRHNCIIWARQEDRPDGHFAEHKLNSPSLLVWCAISADTLIGPFFMQQRINGDVYLNMLQEEFLPQLEAIKGDQINDVVFQQDGATPHRRRDVREWIMQRFPERTIGMGLHMEWPARSPDLTSCDFFLWGYIKELVYVRRPFNDLEDLQQAITEVFDEIRDSPDFQIKLNSTAHAVLARMRRCIEIDGRQVESYRF